MKKFALISFALMPFAAMADTGFVMGIVPDVKVTVEKKTTCTVVPGVGKSCGFFEEPVQKELGLVAAVRYQGKDIFVPITGAPPAVGSVVEVHITRNGYSFSPEVSEKPVLVGRPVVEMGPPSITLPMVQTPLSTRAEDLAIKQAQMIKNLPVIEAAPVGDSMPVIGDQGVVDAPALAVEEPKASEEPTPAAEPVEQAPQVEVEQPAPAVEPTAPAQPASFEEAPVEQPSLEPMPQAETPLSHRLATDAEVAMAAQTSSHLETTKQILQRAEQLLKESRRLSSLSIAPKPKTNSKKAVKVRIEHTNSDGSVQVFEDMNEYIEFSKKYK